MQYYALIALRETLPSQPRLDRLIYDLKYAVDLLDPYNSHEAEQFELGNKIPGYFALDPATNFTKAMRLDVCQVSGVSVYLRGTALVAGSRVRL